MQLENHQQVPTCDEDSSTHVAPAILTDCMKWLKLTNAILPVQTDRYQHPGCLQSVHEIEALLVCKSILNSTALIY